MNSIAQLSPSVKRVVATGKVAHGRVVLYQVVDHECQGRSIWFAGQPRCRCINEAQRRGFDEAAEDNAEMAVEHERRGFLAFVAELERENLPASWADPYVMAGTDPADELPV